MGICFLHGAPCMWTCQKSHLEYLCCSGVPTHLPASQKGC